MAQALRSLVKRRLAAAAEEICGLVERTLAEYEEERGRSKEENQRLLRSRTTGSFRSWTSALRPDAPSVPNVYTHSRSPVELDWSI